MSDPCENHIVWTASCARCRVNELEAENAKLQAERKQDCIEFAQWFRSGNNRNGRTEDECWDLWQAIKEVE